MTTILITNDDGITSPGIIALEKAVRPLGKTVVIAPDRDNSAVSHSITLNRPLRLSQRDENHYSVDGTPTDCVILGINKVLNQPPALVVSGINLGPNLGDDIHYSGTVAAATEAAMQGVPAIAFSAGDRQNTDFSGIVDAVYDIARRLLNQPLPPQNLLNVNIPRSGKCKGIRITRQGRRLWQDAILETQDPRGNLHYWIGGGTPQEEKSDGSDVQAFNAGYISVTPLQLNLTNCQLSGEWATKGTGPL